MKQCPTCKRTYSDSSLSFCLDDGALLSAPFPTQAVGGPAVDPPPTLVMPGEQPAPTQPASNRQSTITALNFPVHTAEKSAPFVSRRWQIQITVTSFLALFSIVGIALYGLPFYYDYMVRELGLTRAQVTSGNALSKLVVGPLFGYC